MAVAVLALLGGWASLLLARSREAAPPLPPYEVPTVALDEPLPPPPPGRLAARQVLRLNNSAEPATLDPAKMTGLHELNIALALFEGLTTLHPRTLRPVPGVAESWDVSPDGRRYVFRLRPARWSNGEPLTAADFVWSWQRVLDPATQAKYASLLYCLEGARPGSGPPGFRALDERTLAVRLEAPIPYFLELLAFATFAPVPRSSVEAHQERWTRPGALVSNGPFILAEWRPFEHILLRRNPHYWDVGRVALEEIDVLAVSDAETALKKCLNNELDWIRELPGEKVAAAARLPGFRYAPQLNTYFFRFNVGRPPLDDRRVRQALNLAVDKESIARYLLRAGQRPARSFVPPILPGYTPAEGPAYDPEQARRLLADAGFPGGRGFPRLALLYNSSGSHQQIAEAIQHMWKAELGIRIALTNQEWGVYQASMQNRDYDIARSSWVADYADPSSFLDCFTTGSGNNRTGWSHAGYDERLALAARETDPARRMAILREAERILVCDEMPILPLYFYVNAYVVHPRVRGVYDNWRNFHPYQYVHIAAD
ncbi:MAG TPA: peptide ABC transporter substrate-binding protein [Planctomycetota bacterium]|nr:peptide ABC transporter substrate-binding protein [Planctomycetota bacterium]HRR82605.1 peptide ABC transporter substrate-binding protein [Planctomycetota bacterium]HRT94801.1 peptide ABC transporter substrate-binding protein [Planctomycetota bacterium]